MINVHTLIDIETLATALDDPELRVVDCRHDLSDPEAGRRAFAEGHIPGALFMHLDDDLSGEKSGTNGRHPLPAPEAFATRIATLGIGPANTVVVYDAAGGAMAARLWWMLRWIGHDKVAVLDGGWPAWVEGNHPVEEHAQIHTPTLYKPATEDERTMDANELAAALEEDEVLLIDARAPDRFAGENETLDPVGGHIPGAVNRFFRNNLENGRFRPAKELRAEFQALLGDRQPEDVVHQCGSGVTACHNLLAMEIAGLSGARLYPGSWSEWCADPSLPVATGKD